MTTNQARVPAGTPTGGQFAAVAHDEAAGVTLSDRDRRWPMWSAQVGAGDSYDFSAPDLSAAVRHVLESRHAATAFAVARLDDDSIWVPARDFDRIAAEPWLAPGSHRIVACEDCAADPARRDDPGCAYCDHGRVTTDRYGQTPWHPDKPGTKVAFEQETRDGRTWVSATITATTRDGLSDAFAVGITADATTRDVYLHSAIPLHAAQAAARHGVTTPEMIEEAACEMNVGIGPSHDEVRAFLARIDDDYCEDIARSAREYRPFRAAELRDEGKTGPALDTTFDTSTLRSGALDDAIDGTKRHFPTQFEATAREHWHGYTLVAKPDGRVETYKDTAWDKPDEQPLLPWSPPTGAPVAHVALDGTVTRVDQPEAHR